MEKEVTIALVGLGGYGLVYLEGLLDAPKDTAFRIVGGIDPEPHRCTRLPELDRMGVPVYATMEDFYRQHRADLVIISSPIHKHCQQTCFALEQGSDVLCEKPLGATIQEARQMIETKNRCNKFVAIGYQWSFSKSIQKLKKDIRAGIFGRPVRLKTIALWPRDEQYYHRNNWAGKLRDESGAWVLDSPANNALAHYLHNMFYILGREIDQSAQPATVTAELYRANDIENYDTVASRIYTENGVEILFYGSHAVENQHGPIIQYEFEKATVSYAGLFSEMVVRFKDGSQRSYGCPDDEQVKKMWDSIKAVRTRENVVCGPEAASAQTLCINGMQESMPRIVDFPQELVHEKGEPGKRLHYVSGLEEGLIKCFRHNKLASELEFEWSKPGKEVDLRNYEKFDPGF